MDSSPSQRARAGSPVLQFLYAFTPMRSAMPRPKPHSFTLSFNNTYQMSIPCSRGWEYGSEQDRHGLGSYPAYVLEGGYDSKISETGKVETPKGLCYCSQEGV